MEIRSGMDLVALDNGLIELQKWCSNKGMCRNTNTIFICAQVAKLCMKAPTKRADAYFVQGFRYFCLYTRGYINLSEPKHFWAKREHLAVFSCEFSIACFIPHMFSTTVVTKILALQECEQKIRKTNF